MVLSQTCRDAKEICARIFSGEGLIWVADWLATGSIIFLGIKIVLATLHAVFLTVIGHSMRPAFDGMLNASTAAAAIFVVAYGAARAGWHWLGRLRRLGRAHLRRKNRRVGASDATN
jgi:CHASE2 domain-containing sensor protein